VSKGGGGGSMTRGGNQGGYGQQQGGGFGRQGGGFGSQGGGIVANNYGQQGGGYGGGSQFPSRGNAKGGLGGSMGSQGGFGGRYGNQGGYGGGYGRQGQSSEPFDQIGFPEQRFGNQGGFSTPPPPPRGGMGGYGQRGGYGQQSSYGGKGGLAPPPTSGLYGQGRYGSSQPRNPYQSSPRNYGDMGRTALGGKGGNQNPPPQQGGIGNTGVAGGSMYDSSDPYYNNTGVAGGRTLPRGGMGGSMGGKGGMGGMGGSIPFAPPASAYIPPAVGGGAPMDENTRRRIEGGMNGPNMGGGGGGRNYTDPTTGNEMYQPPMPTVPEGTMQRMVMPPAINTATGQPNPFGGFSDLNAALNKPQIDPASLYSDPNMGMGGKGGQPPRNEAVYEAGVEKYGAQYTNQDGTYNGENYGKNNEDFQNRNIRVPQQPSGPPAQPAFQGTLGNQNMRQVFNQPASQFIPEQYGMAIQPNNQQMQQAQQFQAGESARQQAANMGLNAQQQEEASRQAAEQFRDVERPAMMSGIGSMGQIRRR